MDDNPFSMPYLFKNGFLSRGLLSQKLIERKTDNRLTERIFTYSTKPRIYD